MTNYTCDQCGIHQSTGGHAVCYGCLQKEVRALHAELQAYKEGIPIEEAPDDGTPILAWKSGSKHHPTVQHNEDDQWGYLTETFDFISSDEQPDKFIYLPSTGSSVASIWRPLPPNNKGGD